VESLLRDPEFFARVHTLPPLTHQLATKFLTEFCLKRPPPEIHANVRVGFEIRGDTVTISEHRPVWNDPTKATAMRVAVLAYGTTTRAWDLFAFDRNDRRMPYDTEPPPTSLAW